MEQGRIAAMHAFGIDAPRMSSRLPYGIYTIPEIATIGPTEQELTRSAVPYEVGVAPFRELSRVQISGGRGGMLKLLFHREALTLLAVHIIGQNATELVHIGHHRPRGDDRISARRRLQLSDPGRGLQGRGAETA